MSFVSPFHFDSLQLLNYPVPFNSNYQKKITNDNIQIISKEKDKHNIQSGQKIDQYKTIQPIHHHYFDKPSPPHIKENLRNGYLHNYQGNNRPIKEKQYGCIYLRKKDNTNELNLKDSQKKILNKTFTNFPEKNNLKSNQKEMNFTSKKEIKQTNKTENNSKLGPATEEESQINTSISNNLINHAHNHYLIPKQCESGNDPEITTKEINQSKSYPKLKPYSAYIFPIKNKVYTEVQTYKNQIKPLEQQKVFDFSKNDIYKIYTFIKPIGQGSFSQVYEAFNINSKVKVAIKVMNKQWLLQVPEAFKAIKNEINILKKISHKNIVKILDLFEDNQNLYICCEFLDGGNLMTRMTNSPLSEEEVKYIMKQILEGLSCCHEKKICHRDIKPENIMLTASGIIKIIDFGLAALNDRNNKCNQMLGSPLYMAPEIVSKRIYGCECDILSCGIILYLMLTGTTPFILNNLPNLYSQIKGANFGMFSFKGKEWNHISEEAKSFLLGMLQKEPKIRCTANQLLLHPFLKISIKPQDHKFISNFIQEKFREFYNQIKIQGLLKEYLFEETQLRKKIESLSNLFINLDYGKSGNLAFADFTKIQNEIILILGIDKKSCLELWEKFEKQLDGTINYKKLLNKIRKELEINKSSILKVLFDKCDTSKLGAIEYCQLLYLFESTFPIKLNSQIPNSKKLNFEEFKVEVTKFVKENYNF